MDDGALEVVGPDVESTEKAVGDVVDVLLIRREVALSKMLVRDVSELNVVIFNTEVVCWVDL